jgi:hypothetical protein
MMLLKNSGIERRGVLTAENKELKERGREGLFVELLKTV